MSKPIELIVANALHEVFGQVKDIQDKVGRAASKLGVEPPSLTDADLTEAMARCILHEISGMASLPLVLRALAAVGAPATPDDLRQRLQAVREAVAREEARS